MIMRQNDTVEVNPPYIVPSLSLKERICSSKKEFAPTGANSFL